VVVRFAVPGLELDTAIAVGPGAGVPAVGGGAAWVPTTGDGMLARVDLGSGTVTARVRVGPATSAPGDLDTAVMEGGAVWAASDAGGTITRVDPATGAVTARLTTAPRPGGLAAGGGFLWAFHFLQSTVTRIDAASGAVRTFEVPGLAGTGIAYENGSLWLLSAQPARLFRVDPAAGAVRQTIGLEVPFPPRRSAIGTWWLGAADGAVWATFPNNRGVARVDPGSGEARYFAVAVGEPFGIAAGGGSAWVATDRAVWRLDAATGRALGASLIPRTPGFGLVSIVYADGAAWLSSYDGGTLMRITS
jgi:streptogramin lyase